MRKILVVYYSSYGHIEAMAYAQAEGAAKVPGTEVIVKRVAELAPPDVCKNAGFKLDQAAPLATPDELEQYDAVIFGTPTRFGNMAAQMRNYLDQTGALFARYALVGKVASVFSSTASQHGGQETTITSFHSTLLHHGMVIAGVPYTEQRLVNMTEITGGSPYGASTLAGADGSRQPTENELEIARFQGRHVTEIARALVLGRQPGA